MNQEPLVSVVRGEPTAEELAALIGALASRSMHADSSLPTGLAAGPSAWVSSARPDPGWLPAAGAWRASGLPR